MKLSKKFIKANEQLCDFENHINAPYIRKSFILNFKPKFAEITICGLGFYELYINGQNITKGYMAPYISNTDDICYYDNYDISELLNIGENVIGIILGNGMRNPFGGFIWDFDKASHRGPVTVALCLEAVSGEKRFEIEADTSFKTHPSPVLFDDLRMGYIYDSRLSIENWNKCGFDDSDWDNVITEKSPLGIKKICSAEPIKAIEVLSAVGINHYHELPFAYKDFSVSAEPLKETLRKNIYVYDFGINTSGVTMLKINGRPGQKITVRHGEALINDCFSINSTAFLDRTEEMNRRYINYGQTDTFICKGGEEILVPKFKYDGFRYAYVEGLEPEQATKDALKYIVMHSDVNSRAEFECSDSVINKLQKCSRRSDLSNFYYFPTDCPHREKNGWTGDASASAEHMLLNLTVENSLKEWLANIRMAQRHDGALPGIVPTGGWGFEWGNGPMWDSVCVNLPYYIYKYTGDKSVIEENVSLIMRYLCYAYSRRDENGLIAIGLGDWLDPFQNINGKIASPLVFTDSAVIYDMLHKAEFLFAEIGRKAESEYVAGLGKSIRDAIRSRLIDHDSMIVSGDCQTSQAVALELGLFEEAEIPAARSRLIDIIHRDGDVCTSGFIGMRYIFHALANAGECELAYKMIVSKSRTGYGYWIEQGATSLWEAFVAEGGTEGCSQNHHFLGDISSWFIQELAGIKVNPGCNDISYFEISPNFIKPLSYAKAHYKSKFGIVSTEWHRVDNKIELNVKLPANTHGRIMLRDSSFENDQREKTWNRSEIDRDILFVLTED